MTVAELIEYLKQMPQDALVVSRGYEYGVNDARPPVLGEVALNVRGPDEWFAGRHEWLEYEQDRRDRESDGATIVRAVALSLPEQPR